MSDDTTPANTDFPRDEMGRMLVPVSSIDSTGRLRQVFENIEELAADIAENGLIQPIVIERSGKLVDGHRRLKAMSEVLQMESVPCVYKDSADPVHTKIMEIMANVAREDFTWQERVLGIVEVHELTTRLKNKARERWTREQTAELFKMSRAHVNNAIWLAELIRAGDEQIIKAEGIREALDILIKRREDEATAMLAKMAVPSAGKSRAPLNAKITVVPNVEMPVDDGFVRGPQARRDFSQLSVEATNDEDPAMLQQVEKETHVVPVSKLFFRADCVEFGKSLPQGFFDHIITDIPYGIDMNNLDGKSFDSVRAEHTVDGNVELYHKMFPVFAHVLKDKGFLVMWYDLDHHQLLRDLGEQYGFTVQRWPLIWCKTDQCKNDAAGQNFTKNIECCYVMRKGNATLTKPQNSCYFPCSAERVQRQLGHPFAKPIELWRWLYSACTLIGQTVWDPFVGVGSSAVAAIEHGLRPYGCELVEEHYNKLIVNVTDCYKRVIKNVTFE